MAFNSERDRVSTIISGLPISAENVRLSELELGSQWQGTSWFFLMHLLAKTFTRVETIPFSSIVNIPTNFGIENWIEPPRLKRQLSTLSKIFNNRGLGNVSIDTEGNMEIGARISPQELRSFADQQYDYAMGRGLVRYSPYIGYARRSDDNFAERIWWHYNTAVYKRPRIFSTTSGGTYLDALIYSISNEITPKNINYYGIKLWSNEHFEIIKPSLIEWQREQMSKEILKRFDIGNTSYIAPRYFAENIKIDSFSEMDVLNEIMEGLNEYPAFPIYNGDVNKIRMAQKLERSNLIIKISESELNYNTLQYSYIIPRSMAEKVDKDIEYKYSTNPIVEHGDTSLTDQIFLSLGRARLYAEALDPRISLVDFNYKQKIENTITSLSDRKEANIERIEKIFDPLTTLGIISISDDKKECEVNPDFEFIIDLWAESYYKIISEPDLITINFAENEDANMLEREQTIEQIKRGVIMDI
jgi:hypothetical protein